MNPNLKEIAVSSLLDYSNDSLVAFADTLSLYPAQITQVRVNTCLLQTKGATAFGRLLTSNSVLTSLYLSDNLIGLTEQVGFSKLAEGLAVNSTLQFLDLSKTLMSDEGLSALSAVVSRHPSLTSLMLTDNRFTPTGLQLLIDSVAANAKNGGRLENIGLSICFISSPLDSASMLQQSSDRSTWFFQSLAQSLTSIGGELASFRSLSLNDSLLTVESARAVADLLRAVPKLTHLFLGSASYLQHSLEVEVPELAEMLATHDVDLMVARTHFKHTRIWEWLTKLPRPPRAGTESS